jgi:hypothetical protein
MTALRLGLIGTGVAAGLYGLRLLLDLGWDNLVAAALWLGGGVVLHDGVLAPAVIAVSLLTIRLLRGRVPAPLVVAGIVLGSVTLVGVPVLGRFGARADNATLLDRSYGVGWWVLAGLTLVCAAAAVLLKGTRGGGHGTDPGGR